MASNYYKQVVDAVRRQGFTRIRQGMGSHEIWTRAGTEGKISIPAKLRSRHTANGY